MGALDRKIQGDEEYREWFEQTRDHVKGMSPQMILYELLSIARTYGIRIDLDSYHDQDECIYAVTRILQEHVTNRSSGGAVIERYSRG